MATTTTFQHEYASITKVPARETTWNVVAGSFENIKAESYLVLEPSPESSYGETTIQRRLGLTEFRPPQENVNYAAVLMNNFLAFRMCQNTETKGFALAGGIGMKAFGFLNRPTYDIDIFWKGVPMDYQRWMIAEERFVLPHPRLFEQAFQLFIKVGPSFWDARLTQNSLIKIDMAGNAFPARNFHRHCIIRTLVVSGQDQNVQVPNLMTMMKAKMEAYADRYRPKDWDDIKLMLDTYHEHVMQSENGARPRIIDIEDAHIFLTVVPANRQLDPAYRRILNIPA